MGGNDCLSEMLKNRFNIIAFDEIGSTSTFARGYVDKADRSFIVTANRQTDGRGRQGRAFYSEHGGIYFTVAFCDDILEQNLALITPAAAVSVRDALSAIYGIEFDIKWVNDIYVCGKKVAGILSEALRRSDGGIKAILVGIGINVGKIDFPPEINKAGCISDYSGVSADTDTIISDIVTRFLVAEAMPRELLIESYKKNNIVLGRKISFELFGNTMCGRAVDIGAAGELIVETENGTITLSSNDISIKFLD